MVKRLREDETSQALKFCPKAQTISVPFKSGDVFTFHNMWLRDCCKCADCSKEGMRPSKMSAHIWSLKSLEVKKAELTDYHLTCEFSDGHTSKFPMTWLEIMAPIVGKSEKENPIAKVPAVPEPGKQRVWTNKDMPGDLPKYDLEELKTKPELHADFLKCLTYPGCAIITGVPQDPDLKENAMFKSMEEVLGRFNQHPVRDNNHWTISTDTTKYDKIFSDVSKQSLDYVTSEPLLNHTDLTDYLGPPYILAMHVLAGKSRNSVVDGFAAALKLKKENPEAFELLTTRKLCFARLQEFYKWKLQKWATAPMIQLDKNGDIEALRISEGKRTFFQVSFDDFPKFWKAYEAFNNMLDHPDLHKRFDWGEGQILVVNNHRIAHGRVSIPGGYRILIGGTMTKDVFYNRVRANGIWKHREGEDNEEHDVTYHVEVPNDHYMSYMNDKGNMPSHEVGETFYN